MLGENHAAKCSQRSNLGKTTRQNALNNQTWAKPRGKKLSTIKLGQNHAAKCSQRSNLGKTTRQNALNDQTWIKPRGKMLSTVKLEQNHVAKSSQRSELEKTMWKLPQTEHQLPQTPLGAYW